MTRPTACCSDCGADRMMPARPGRHVCERCGTCWDDGWPPQRVDSIACPGCPRRTVCESRPTWLADARTSEQRLRDGTPVIVRPLLYSDRDELARRFDELSREARRLRFVSPPSRLSPQDLEYLTNLDYHDHFAWAVFTTGQKPEGIDPEGIGVARYVRDRQEESRAEAAVTVVEAYQRRGVGTLLLSLLAEEAMRHGISTFSAYVLWDNDAILEPLQELGARLEPEGSGIARVMVDLAPLVGAAVAPDRSHRSRLLRLLSTPGREAGGVIGAYPRT